MNDHDAAVFTLMMHLLPALSAEDDLSEVWAACELHVRLLAEGHGTSALLGVVQPPVL